MESRTRAIVEAFRVLDSTATTDDILVACRQLFMDSDECHCAQPKPFDASEVDAVAKALYGYILDPDAAGPREIVFSFHRPLEGKSIELNEYVSWFSEDMMYQGSHMNDRAVGGDDRRRGLMAFLAGMLIRYRFCVFEDRAAFPVSKILEYFEGAKALFSTEKRDDELPEALLATLRALRSLEPSYLNQER